MAQVLYYLGASLNSWRLLDSLGTFCLAVCVGDGYSATGYSCTVQVHSTVQYTVHSTQYRFIASLFCKSATAYNPVIYFFMFRGFREDTRMVLSRYLFSRILGKSS